MVGKTKQNKNLRKDDSFARVCSESSDTPKKREAAALDPAKTDLPDVACASLSLQFLRGLCGLRAQPGA